MTENPGLPPLEIQKEIVAELEGYQQEIRNYEVPILLCFFFYLLHSLHIIP